MNAFLARAARRMATLPRSVVACVLFSASCAPTAMPDERRQLLSNWGSELVLPELAALTAAAQRLSDSVAELCQEHDASALQNAQQSWHEARAPWKRFELFAFGPATEPPLRLGPRLDFWPLRHELVEAAVERSVSSEVPANALLAAEKGLPALEYVLFSARYSKQLQAPFEPHADPDAGSNVDPDAGSNVDPDAGSNVDPDASASSDAGAKIHAPDPCNYLNAATAELVADARQLHNAWDPKQGGFLNQLVEAGRTSDEYDTLQMALGEVVGKMAYLVETIRLDKLQRPLGKSPADIQPEKAESRFSERTLRDIEDNLLGLHHALFGLQGDGGLVAYLRARGKPFDIRLQHAVQSAQQAVTRIREPFAQALSTRREHVETALDRLEELQRLIAVEVVNALSLTLQFNDNDGD